jgi:hypothetical protein
LSSRKCDGTLGRFLGRHRPERLDLHAWVNPYVVGMNTSSKSTSSGGTSAFRTGLEARLAARPEGLPAPANFEIAEVAVPAPAQGQVLVRNLFMSLDPGMLTLFAGESSLPMPRYEVGEVMYGDAIAEITAEGGPCIRTQVPVSSYRSCGPCAVRRRLPRRRSRR